MSNLVESIVNRELVSAKAIFEARMEEIRDQKLYEAKRCLGAQLDEASNGAKTAKEMAELRRRGYRPAKEVLGHLLATKMKPIPGTIHDKSYSKKIEKEPKEEKLTNAKTKAKLKAHRQTVKGLSTKITKKRRPRGKLKQIKIRGVSEQTLGEAGLAPTRIGKIYRAGVKGAGEFASRLATAKHVWKQYKQQQAQQQPAQQQEPKVPFKDTKTGKAMSGGFAALKHVTSAIRQSQGGVGE